MFKHCFASVRPFYSNLLERFEDLDLPAESRDEESDDDGEVEFSNLQELWPNDEHVSNVCDIVNPCSNLESLGLCGMQYIDGDLLKWTP
jgi:hypothetical protein